MTDVRALAEQIAHDVYDVPSIETREEFKEALEAMLKVVLSDAASIARVEARMEYEGRVRGLLEANTKLLDRARVAETRARLVGRIPSEPHRELEEGIRADVEAHRPSSIEWLRDVLERCRLNR